MFQTTNQYIIAALNFPQKMVPQTDCPEVKGPQHVMPQKYPCPENH